MQEKKAQEKRAHEFKAQDLKASTHEKVVTAIIAAIMTGLFLKVLFF